MPENDLPIEHVQRPQPPWRLDTAPLTECGRLSGQSTVISRDELIAKVKRLGQQRAAFTTCMTCWDKCRTNAGWDVDPVECLMREAARYQWATRYHRWHPDEEASAKTAAGLRFRDELLAIAVLIDAHRDEFEQLVSGIGDAVRLDEKRQARRVAGRRAQR